ncbi:MAG: hypothetical protein ABI346_10395, partial [Candidatus Baltobacteraceae bacterium]
MDFTLRDATQADLDQCLALTTDRFLYDLSQLTALRRMWSHLLVANAGKFFVIADARAPSRVRLFGNTVFVTDERADKYHSLESPKIGLSMAEDFNNGISPFLSRQEIANSNAGAGLNLLVTHHGYEERGDGSDEKLRAASYEVSRRLMTGWNLRSYTNEVFARNGTRDGKEMGQAAGLRVVQYSDRQLQRAGIPSEQAPWVWLATRQDAAEKPASMGLAMLFLSFSRPRLGLDFREQDTLQLALDGYTDEWIAKTMGVSLSTVKKCFRTIYDKVEDAGIDPET